MVGASLVGAPLYIPNERKMKKYGIIGYPLAQSASPAFFNKKFADEGIDAQYIPFEIESTGELPCILEEHPELQGFNVTIPHKIAIMQHLEGMSDGAKAINAVNVVKVMRDADGKAHLWGYNSDVIGFTRSIEPLLKEHHKKALVLGTGGASKAIIYALEQLGIECLSVSRTAKGKAIAYSDITPEIMESHTVIVNLNGCTEDVLESLCGPHVNIVCHGGRGSDRINTGYLSKRIGNVSRSVVTVHGLSFSCHWNYLLEIINAKKLA